MGKYKQLFIQQKEKEACWVTYIHQRIARKKNFMALITGEVGSGKSYTSLSIGEQTDPSFNAGRVVFDPLELINLIEHGEKVDGEMRKLPRGSVIIFEEAGVGFNNKNWMSKTNKMLNYVFQTFRHKGYILILNTPYADFIDSASRKIFQAEFHTMKILQQKKLCQIKPQLIQYNSRYKKYYYKQLKVLTTRGVRPIKYWNVKIPSEDLIKEYEKKKTAFTSALNKRAIDELTIVSAQEKATQKGLKPLSVVETRYVNAMKKPTLLDDIVKKFRRDEGSILGSLTKIKKKGYEVVMSECPDTGRTLYKIEQSKEIKLGNKLKRKIDKEEKEKLNDFNTRFRKLKATLK